MSGWISVEERMPELDDDGISINLLLFCPGDRDRMMRVGYFENDEPVGCWMSEAGYPTMNVSHWMPLPEPPK